MMLTHLKMKKNTIRLQIPDTHKHERTSVGVYIYIYIYGEMVDCGESDKMIKINGKMDTSDTSKGFSSNISFFL